MFDIRQGDVLEVLRSFSDNSFDGCLTDPPYGLTAGKKGGSGQASENLNSPAGRSRATTGFMGLGWDASVPGVEVWSEMLRVLKPGAFLLAFGGTRTHHRLMCAIEDAAFDIRDCAMWLYGSGFPKSLNISKSIDKASGAERFVIGITAHPDGKQRSVVARDSGVHDGGHRTNGVGLPITAPSTDGAKLFDGYGTALKPAWEPIVVAMKPCDGTFAENAMRHGVAGINIEDSRVHGGKAIENTDTGRWPANVILDEESARLLDQQSGDLSTTGYRTSSSQEATVAGTNWLSNNHKSTEYPNDSGGASRFFYCAKASSGERNGNQHPTVKPVDLARYLAKLILPPERHTPRRLVVPYSGSGSEMLGALESGWDEIIGIEREDKYIATARKRLEGHCPLFLKWDSIQ